MKKINVAFSWPKDDITKAWSGTAYQILQQLKKDYDVNVVDISCSLTTRIARRTFRILGATYLPRKLAIMDMTEKLKNRKMSGPVFCFDPLDFDKAGITGEDIYLYIDCSCRYLLHLHDTDIDAYNASGFGYSREALVKLADEEDAAYAKCKKVFVMGRWLKAFFDENYDKSIAGKVIWVGAGVNLPRSPKIVEKEKAFLFVGIDFYRKSGDLVIKAFEKAGLGDDVRLFIAGPESVDAIGYKSEEYLPKNIIFLGKLKSEELQRYFEKCKVFIMPSRFEAYGIVFLEAISCGCKIIATDKNEMGYFVKESAGLTTTLDVKEMSAVMKKAMEEDAFACRDSCSWNEVYERMKL